MKTPTRTLLSLVLVAVAWCCFAEKAIVIDAGSSGTRAYIYRFDRTANGFHPVKPLESFKIHPGISTYALTKSTTNIVAYSKKIAHFLDKHLSKLDKRVPIYWYSTAGMRLISPYYQTKAYNIVNKYFDKHSKFYIKEIRTIPGYEEGIFLWVSANAKELASSDKKTAGVLDFGGASTQITFQTNQSKDTSYMLHIGKKTIQLMSHSFLGMGTNEFRHQHSNNTHCFNPGYPLPNGNQASGNFQSCTKSLKHAFDQTQNLMKNYKIPEGKIFYIYDDIKNTLSKHFIDWKNQSFNNKDLAKLGNKVCSFPWKSIKKHLAKNPYIFEYCLHIAYLSNLLKTYGFTSNERIQVKKGSWTLGKALIIANQGYIQKENYHTNDKPKKNTKKSSKEN